jgi:hypothetical protein
MMVRSVSIALALVLVASSVQAQVTTYIAPPRAQPPTREMVAAADSARRDSVAQVATNMKAWVDSAAGVAVPATVGRVDSAALVNDPGRPVSTFDDGAVAPATASNLPAMAVVGVLFLVIGSALLANRPRG